MASQAIINTDDIDWLEEFDRSFVIDVGKSLKTLEEDYEELDMLEDLVSTKHLLFLSSNYVTKNFSMYFWPSFFPDYVFLGYFS